MNLRRLSKPIAVALLSAGMVTLGVAAPADAAQEPPVITVTNGDTGWG